MAKLDENGLIVFEQCAWPGSVGDSCAETCRMIVLTDSLVWPAYGFLTSTGYVRHPSLSGKPAWGEDDFSSDQALALIMALHRLHHQSLYWTTAPGKISSIGVMAAARKMYRTLGVINLVQALLLRFVKYRWSDEHRKIVPMGDSSADYLNFYVTCVFLRRRGHTLLSRLCLTLVPKSRVMQAVRDYYKPEPNSAWIVEAYERAN